jgi:hypothetical protein
VVTGGGANKYFDATIAAQPSPWHVVNFVQIHSVIEPRLTGLRKERLAYVHHRTISRQSDRVSQKLLSMANDPNAVHEFKRLERSFTELADNAQWMIDNHVKTVRATEPATL